MKKLIILLSLSISIMSCASLSTNNEAQYLGDYTVDFIFLTQTDVSQDSSIQKMNESDNTPMKLYKYKGALVTVHEDGRKEIQNIKDFTFTRNEIKLKTLYRIKGSDEIIYVYKKVK